MRNKIVAGIVVGLVGVGVGVGVGSALIGRAREAVGVRVTCVDNNNKPQVTIVGVKLTNFGEEVFQVIQADGKSVSVRKAGTCLAEEMSEAALGAQVESVKAKTPAEPAPVAAPATAKK